MTATVTEVPIDRDFVKLASAEVCDLILNKRSTFFNVTQFCRRNQRPLNAKGYMKQKHPQKLESVLQKYFSTDLSETVAPNAHHDASVVGIYLHPAFLLDLAQRLSPELYMHSAAMLQAFFHKDEFRMYQWSCLFGRRQTVVCNQVSDHPAMWCISIAQHQLIVNERGWFDGHRFCATNQRKLTNFKNLADVGCLLAYLECRSLLRDRYFHPLLFLRLAAWVDLELYVECVLLLFGNSNPALNALWRREITAAVDAVPESRLESLFEQYRGQDGADLPILPSSPSDDQEAARRLASLNPTYIDVDDESSDSDEEVEEEEVRTLTQTEHEVELARVRRELDRERQQKEAALAGKRETESALQRALVEKRQKEVELEDVMQELENLKIGQERYRMQLRKRPHRESANVLTAASDDVAKYECLVLFKNKENVVFGYRRQLRNVVRAIHEKVDDIAEFVGWFITKSAVYDYNRCKSRVSEKAAECGRNLRTWANQMELDDEGGCEFDLPDVICTTLRIELKVVEADVKILARLYGKPVRCDDYVATTDPEKAKFLARVHKWIKEQHAKFIGGSPRNGL